ncbi:MAG: glycosyltransferase [Saprospirales bacterium]|nr:glycosyltransferase [Saprospirales bacterium]
MEYKNTTSDKPLVSVCIQTYNHAGYIVQCLDGILSQERDFPIEVIIGEDDSTDGTRDICISYAEKYPDLIRLFLRSEKDKIWINGQKTGRFNFMSNLQAARGKYIALCDGDDYWVDVQKLKKQVSLLETGTFTVCGTNARLYYQTTGALGPALFKHQDRTEFSREDLVFHNPFPTSTVVFKKASGDFPQWFWETPYLDWSLYFFHSKDGKAIYLEDLTAVYRIHSGGLWGKIGTYQRIRNGIALRSFFLKEIDQVSLQRKVYHSLRTDAFRALRFSKGPKDARLFLTYSCKWLLSYV